MQTIIHNMKNPSEECQSDKYESWIHVTVWDRSATKYGFIGFQGVVLVEDKLVFFRMNRFFK